MTLRLEGAGVDSLVGKQCNSMKQQVVVGGNMTLKCSEQNFLGESFYNLSKSDIV